MDLPTCATRPLRSLYRCSAVLLFVSVWMAIPAAFGQSGVDTLHDGYELTESFSSKLGPDAEAFYRISNHSPSGFNVTYSSTLGTNVIRHERAQDRAGAGIFVLGFAKGMRRELPGTTSLGLSAAVLQQLRNTGQAPLSVIYDSASDTMPGILTLVQEDAVVPVLIDNQLVNLPTVHARGVFQQGNRRGIGEFYFYDNRKNPLTLQYTVKFSWENVPRKLRITRIVAGASQQAAMEQALKTVRELSLYGIHFDFNKASIRRDTDPLIGDIATTLKNNPTWTLSVNGYTDSIGKKSYNQKLSERRAISVVTALVNKHGISPGRLQARGLGQTNPKASNKTLQGRALNRRVQLVRTDR
jgi:outer membrane protein OmpA-like peptidoglycan-associated protein